MSSSDIYEIERRFLLSEVPAQAEMNAARVLRMQQGYITGRKLKLRVRWQTDVKDGSEEFKWGVKSGAGVKRIQLEDDMPKALFDQMWPFTEGSRIFKLRREMPTPDGLIWEIDEFDHINLVLAEIELPDEADEVSYPAWLRPYVIREVTHERGFTNAALAR